MPSGYWQSPKLVKGAFVRLDEGFIGPVPNIIVFQYNPEKMSRTVSGLSTDKDDANPFTQAFDPKETIKLTLELDATDGMEAPDTHPVASRTGVADRLAAIEMLLYPPAVGGVLAGVSKALLPLLGGSAVPRTEVPIVLFIWGPGRVLPIRLTSFEVEEQAFLTTLYPIRATVNVSLRVITDAEFEALGKPLSAGEELAKQAYLYTRNQKEALALANVANTLESAPGQVGAVARLLLP